ncbi:HNH endonuclease [Mucilaginibacter lappiensis]|uniref:HNH endonuclease n=1 Tax=Mucilaginibacter lappiensis TaxID=354630 RepID=UPI003D215F1F
MFQINYYIYDLTLSKVSSGINNCRYPSLRSQGAIKSIDNTNRLQQSIAIPDKTAIAIYDHGTYGALLFDSRWKERRSLILNRDGHRCVICSKSENLQVHHRQYHFVLSTNQFKPPWDYQNELLITLCKSCHNRGHSKFKVPTLTI